MFRRGCPCPWTVGCQPVGGKKTDDFQASLLSVEASKNGGAAVPFFPNIPFIGVRRGSGQSSVGFRRVALLPAMRIIARDSKVYPGAVGTGGIGKTKGSLVGHDLISHPVSLKPGGVQLNMKNYSTASASPGVGPCRCYPGEIGRSIA
jgi:hypothetical protein